MRGSLAGFFSETPRRSSGVIRRQKKAGLELLQASRLTSHQPNSVSSDNNNACDACNTDGHRSKAGRCNYTFGNTGYLHNICNSCAGNSRIPDIRNSYTHMKGNRPQLRPVRFQPKPEHQLVSSEPKPVRLPLTEVKEVFS